MMQRPLLNPPGSRILLHVCCAPCSGAIIEAMCRVGLRPTLFWSNSNIFTEEEYARRLAVLEPYAEEFGLPVVVDEYEHEAWLASERERLQNDPADYPERGARCLNCFEFRLLRAARYALANGFDCLATSLASSRWKSLEQVEKAGNRACETAIAEITGAGAEAVQKPVPEPGQQPVQVAAAKPASEPAEKPPLVFWAQNWRKGGLQPRRDEIISERGFYNQDFCGCEFSLRGEKTALTDKAAQTDKATQAAQTTQTTQK